MTSTLCVELKNVVSRMNTLCMKLKNCFDNGIEERKLIKNHISLVKTISIKNIKDTKIEDSDKAIIKIVEEIKHRKQFNKIFDSMLKVQIETTSIFIYWACGVLAAITVNAIDSFGSRDFINAFFDIKHRKTYPILLVCTVLIFTFIFLRKVLNSEVINLEKATNLVAKYGRNASLEDSLAILNSDFFKSRFLVLLKNITNIECDELLDFFRKKEIKEAFFENELILKVEHINEIFTKLEKYENIEISEVRISKHIKYLFKESFEKRDDEFKKTKKKLDQFYIEELKCNQLS
jgi:hypothetical protein